VTRSGSLREKALLRCININIENYHNCITDVTKKRYANFSGQLQMGFGAILQFLKSILHIASGAD
jgi:hypothetical protein